MIAFVRCLLVRYIPFNGLFSLQFSGTGYRVPKKLKCFNLYKLYTAIAKKEKRKNKPTTSITTMSVNGFNGYNTSYGTWPENQNQQEYMDLQYCSDVLDTSRFVMGDGYGSDSSSSEESYEDYDWTDPANCVTPPACAATATATATAVECTTPPAVKTKAELKLKRSHEEPRFDINDPLRYCLDIGYISRGEYDKWKIVKSSSSSSSSPTDHTRRALDFGPGYNSDSSDSEDDAVSAPALVTTSRLVSYGTGYMQDGNRTAYYDPWFPNPDYMRVQEQEQAQTQVYGLWCVVFENDPNDFDSQPPASISRLNAAFGLKIMWERFVESKRQRQCTLQEFWQTNALEIYEALQELVETHAKLFNSTSAGTLEEFHTNPVEMLEHTFETIGRMSRCIAEDFNTDSCVNYVEEFVRALYVELRFMELHGDSVPR